MPSHFKRTEAEHFGAVPTLGPYLAFIKMYIEGGDNQNSSSLCCPDEGTCVALKCWLYYVCNVHNK